MPTTKDSELGPTNAYPHRKFRRNAPDWYEEVHERQSKAR